jgi:outer membrane protein
MESALVKAYQNNPQLNAQRASVRSIDENVPQALSGYRPRVAITGSAGEQFTDATLKSVGAVPSPTGGPAKQTVTYTGTSATTTPWSYGATAQQTLFNGFQTANRTRSAESTVSSAREGLRILEQTVLLTAATAYMDVLRDTAALEVQRSNVRVLQETLKQTRDRFEVGEVTRTDVAQAEAQLAAGQSSMLAAESTLNTSRANYRQVIGVDPTNLAPGSPVDRFSPHTLLAAIDQGLIENPNVTAAMYGIDVAFLQVKVNEGALYPTLVAQASVQQGSFIQNNSTPQFWTASATASLTVPVYQGGQEFALNGVREEARVGQRTTLDVLNAQQALVNARIALVNAQHDRVVASYSVLSATGRLSPQVMHLPTILYDPTVHYHQVRDAWIGVRTPDGH